MSVMKKKIPGVILFWTLLAATFLVTGCARDAAPPLPPENLEEEGQGQEKESSPEKNKVVLYFLSEDTNMLAGEERAINAGDKDFQIAVLEELIKGPQNPSLGTTIPPDVQVLGVTVEEKGTAVVDFSRELLTSHWGGSMGEIMTVYSVVNTLASLPGIEQVKFLVEGEEIETLTGHLDISEPVEPDWDLAQK
jgi:spore germination protein GerM